MNNAITRLDATPRTVAEQLLPMGGRYLVDIEIEVPVQINGKVCHRVVVPAHTDADALEVITLADTTVIVLLGGAIPKNVVVIPNRMINLVI